MTSYSHIQDRSMFFRTLHAFLPNNMMPHT